MITSRQNQYLKDMRRVGRCKDDRRALLEGPHLLREALVAGLAPDFVLATPEFVRDPTHEGLLSRLGAAPLEVEGRLLAEHADSDSPRGIVAVVPLAHGGADRLPVKEGGVYLYLDGLQDPGNLGALARVAEASGACGMALSPGTASPRHPRALRASAGSLLRMPIASRVSHLDVDRRLESISPTWVALTARDGQDLYRGTPLDPPLILALGAEGPGLSARLEGRIDLRCTVPMEATVESLNATVAAALVLYEIRRRVPLDGSESGLLPG